MTKALAVAMGAMLLFGGAQAARASCAGDAAEARAECLRDRGNSGECAALYRDDLRECGRYEPMRRMPMRRPEPRPLPPHPMPPHPMPVPPHR